MRCHAVSRMMDHDAGMMEDGRLHMDCKAEMRMHG